MQIKLKKLRQHKAALNHAQTATGNKLLHRAGPMAGRHVKLQQQQALKAGAQHLAFALGRAPRIVTPREADCALTIGQGVCMHIGPQGREGGQRVKQLVHGVAIAQTALGQNKGGAETPPLIAHMYYKIRRLH